MSVFLTGMVINTGAFAPRSIPMKRQSFCNVYRTILRATHDQAGRKNLDGYESMDTDDMVELLPPLRGDKTNLSGNESLPEDFMCLPRHSHRGVNQILEKTESILRGLHKNSKRVEMRAAIAAKEAGRSHERIFANNYVDLGKVDTVGFDYDYTLVTYTENLLELLYEMALERLVDDRQYPTEMLNVGLKFDPFFSIRGLAVDKETGWICHLSYTHKVAVAWEGREKLPTSRIYKEYRGKRALTPSERRKRLKPLNDLFSMAECCLIADTVQFFKERQIPFCPQNVVTDVLSAIGGTHISGDFHRLVAQDPERYFDPTPHLKQVLDTLKDSGKHLILVSNSPFWYVDAGMRYVLGNNWRDEWDAIITSAGKPMFYTDDSRPFREICQETRRLMFKRVERFERGKVYTEGCLKELMRLMDWTTVENKIESKDTWGISSGSLDMATANVLYVGDSLFADLVDAKREFSWTTAAVTPEVGYEMELQTETDFALARRTIDLLLHALRLLQDELGTSLRTAEDVKVLDCLERLVSVWRDRESDVLGNPFGSVFRARYQPSLFAHSLRRYCDLYMTSVSSLRHYSPQHRFYPEQNHLLLAHEIDGADPECWTTSLDEILEQ
jgi:HAD superfamily 5'-nucleotidase-like hydrolase